MDAARALAELTEISSQVQAVVIVDDGGDVLAATSGDGAALAEAGSALLERGARIRDGRRPAQVDATTSEGSVFVVADAGRTIVATTAPEPTAGLVFYDLRNCLRSLAEPDAA